MSRALIVVLVAAGAAVGLASTGVLRYDLASLVASSGNTFTEALNAIASPATEEPAVRPKDRAGRATDLAKPSFDIIRIDPDGFSVFAGSAMPKSHVTILANGKAIATTQASESGDWSLVFEYPFAAGEYQLSVTARLGDRGPVTQGQTVSMAVAKGARAVATAAPPERKSTGYGTTNAVREFERMVVSARSGNPAQVASLPLPITFVYDETNFTAEGRRAAALLAEYLRLRKLDNVTLSGHADERGSDQYNLDLSRLRLESVARYLRENGFTGKLVLVPKGKSEPYTGIDRQLVPKEQAFQLDRRVELHVNR